MSGYKRVNFYELCRLCATNQQKEKTHIFQEEGRKIQLQNKIQSCLSLKVCENDFLPKVVCSQCLRSLEESYIFRKECFTSETMLSSYFNNFRYTDDFKKSGKVYIKDTSPKSQQIVFEPNVLPTNPNNLSNINIVQNPSAATTQESLSYYTVQLPTMIPNTVHENKAAVKSEYPTKSLPLSQPQLAYNTVNLSGAKQMPKNNNLSEPVGNLTVNANGEILGITPMLDIDALLAQYSQKTMKTQLGKMCKKAKQTEIVTKALEQASNDRNVIKIDLTAESDDNDGKAQNVKNRLQYAIKMNRSVVLNQLPDLGVSPLPSRPQSSVILSPQPSQHQNPLPNAISSNLNLVSNVISISNLNMNQPVHTHQPNNVSFAPNMSSSCITSTGNLNHMPSLNVGNNQSMNFHQVSSIKQQNLNLSASVNISSNVKLSNLGHTTNNYNINASNNGLTNLFTPSSSSIVCMNSPCQVSSMSSNMPNVVSTSANLIPSTAVSTQMDINRTNLINSTPNPITMNSPTPNINTAPNLNCLPNLNQSPPTKLHPNPSLSAAIEAANVKIHICDICHKNFKRREHLYQHMKLHTGFRPFKCENCNKSFMRKEHLLRHMTSHSGLKNFMCNICEKTFSRNDNLLKHRKTHEKQANFTCEICQKQFVIKHYYLAHKLTHESEKCTVNQVWGMLKV